MADAAFVQDGFGGGEWSLAQQGRITAPDYRKAMNVCLNGMPLDQEQWTRRPGTRFASATRGGAPGRVIPFAFQRNAPYTLEFTDGFLRAYAGASLAMTNDTQTVSSISPVNVPGADNAPTMISNGLPTPYAISASAENTSGNTGPAWRAMDNSTASGFGWRASTGAGSWWQIDFGLATPLGSYTITSRTDTSGNEPTAWTLQGSDTGAFAGEQTTIDTRSSVSWSSVGQTQTFTLSSGQTFRYYRWVFSAVNGGGAIIIAEIRTISPPSLGVLSVITASAHGWATGDTVIFGSLSGNNPLLQNRQCTITVTGVDGFTLADAITGNVIDVNQLGTFVSATVSRVMELSTPYVGGSWSTNRLVQANTDAVILNGGTKPYILTVVNGPQTDRFAEFAIDPATFKDGPYLDPFTNGVQATPSGKKGIVSLTFSFAEYDSSKAYAVGDYVSSSSISYQSLIDQNVGNTPSTSPTAWTPVPATNAISATGIVGTDIGRHVRLFSEPLAWLVGTNYNAGNVVKYAGAYYTALTTHTAALTNAPTVSLTNWGVNPTGAIWSWGRITAIINQISQSLSGSTNFGSLTSNGGVNAAFDGNVNQSSAACASRFTFGGGTNLNFITQSHVGKNYTGASAQKIESATVFPSTNRGFIMVATTDGTGALLWLTFNLRASQTAPTGPSDGVLLGTRSYPNTVPSTRAPVTIKSNDTATAWNYVWIELYSVAAVDTTGFDIEHYVAELQFFSPPSATAGSAVSVEILGPDLLYTTSISTWRIGVFNDTLGWPTCGTYHEGRLWLSGVVGNRLDASVPNDMFNFAPTQPDGTVTDASAIDYTLAAPDVNMIHWMEPDQQGIIVGTEAGEWLVQASNLNSPLTPTSMQAHRVTRIGCSEAIPVRTEHTTVFIHRYKRKLMEYFSDVFSGKFSAPDIAVKAKHLANRGIEELAYQQDLSPVIWARCSDGSLIGCSYNRVSLMSSQGPTFAGWHRHALGSGRSVESICGGPSIDGTRDTLAMITNDASNIRHVEFMTDYWQEGSDITSAWYLDDAIVPSYTQSIVLGGVSSLQLLGLWHLNGKTVSVFAGGLDLGDYVVADGAVAVPFNKNPLFTPEFVASFDGALPIVVGFPYSSRGQIVRPATPQESGARTGPALGKVRRVQTVTALLYDTQNMSFGTDFDRMNEALLQSRGGRAYAPNQLFSGVFRASLTDDYGFDSMIAWEAYRMLPCNVATIGGLLQTQDA